VQIRKPPALASKEVKTARLADDPLSGLGLTLSSVLVTTSVRAHAACLAPDVPTFALIG